MRKRHDIQILIVDDEEGILEIFKENFEIDGFKVITAISGNEAVKILKTTRLDFIISDVRMPNGDGITLLKYAKNNYSNIPLVLVSGFAEITTEEVKNLGGIDLITKPANIDKLIELVCEYCDCE